MAFSLKLFLVLAPPQPFDRWGAFDPWRRRLYFAALGLCVAIALPGIEPKDVVLNGSHDKFGLPLPETTISLDLDRLRTSSVEVASVIPQPLVLPKDASKAAYEKISERDPQSGAMSSYLSRQMLPATEPSTFPGDRSVGVLADLSRISRGLKPIGPAPGFRAPRSAGGRTALASARPVSPSAQAAADVKSLDYDFGTGALLPAEFGS